MTNRCKNPHYSQKLMLWLCNLQWLRTGRLLFLEKITGALKKIAWKKKERKEEEKLLRIRGGGRRRFILPRRRMRKPVPAAAGGGMLLEMKRSCSQFTFTCISEEDNPMLMSRHMFMPQPAKSKSRVLSPNETKWPPAPSKSNKTWSNKKHFLSKQFLTLKSVKYI